MKFEKKWMILISMVLLVFIISFNTTAMINALLAIKSELNISSITLPWVMNIYILTAAVFILAGGKAGDIFDRKNILIISSILYFGSSLIIGLSQNITILLIGRAVQGIGAAFLISGSLATLRIYFKGKSFSFAVGLWTGMIGVGNAFGPYGGGVLTDFFSWRYIFVLNVIVVFISTFIIILYMDSDSSGKYRTSSIDFKGFVMFSLGVTFIILAVFAYDVAGGISIKAGLLFLAGSSLVYKFYYFEKSISSPIMHVELLKNRQFSCILFAGFVVLFFIMGVPYFLNVYFQNNFLFNFSASRTGAVMLPFSMMIFLFSLLVALLTLFISRKNCLIFAFSIMLAGLSVLTISSQYMNLFWLIIGMLFVGIGIGMAGPLLSTLALNSVPEANAGEVSGIYNTVGYLAELFAVVLGNTIYFSAGRYSLFLSTEKINVTLENSGEFLNELIMGKITEFNNLINYHSGDHENLFLLAQGAGKLGIAAFMMFLAVISLIACIIIVCGISRRGTELQ